MNPSKATRRATAKNKASDGLILSPQAPPPQQVSESQQSRSLRCEQLQHHSKNLNNRSSLHQSQIAAGAVFELLAITQPELPRQLNKKPPKPKRRRKPPDGSIQCMEQDCGNEALHPYPDGTAHCLLHYTYEREGD